MIGSNGNGTLRPRSRVERAFRASQSRKSDTSRLQASMHAARQQFVELAYRAAKSSRYRSSATVLGGSADAHYSHGLDYARIRELAREFDRDDPNLGVLVERALDNVLGEGLRVDPATGDPNVNETLRQLWDEWASSPSACDWFGESDFDEIERLALRHGWIDGDAFMILDDRSGTVRFEESDRVTSPDNAMDDVVHGITRDAAGRLRGYLFVAGYVPGERKRTGARLSRQDLVELPVEQVIHFHLFRKRKTQSRGISAFAPAFDQIAIATNAEFALLVKHQVTSCIAVFLETQYPEGTVLGGSDTEMSTLDSETDLEFAEMQPGMIGRLAPGEKMSGFSPSVRTADDAEFLEGRVRSIGLQIGMPLELGMLTSKNQSFSALRGINEAYKVGARRVQVLAGTRGRSRVYRWKVGHWVREGRVPDRPDITKHRILARSWSYLEPEVEARADALRIEKRLASPRQVAAERGRDYDDVIRESVEDAAALAIAAHAKAIELQSQGIETSARELLGGGREANGEAQATALNGAQIAALQSIVQAVAAKQLPAESAIELVVVGFPQISREVAEKMIRAAEKAEPPPEPAPAPAKPPKPAAEPSAEAA